MFGVADHVAGGFWVTLVALVLAVHKLALLVLAVHKLALLVLASPKFALLVFRLPLGGHKDGLEDGVLQGVGVLKFVDEGGLPVGG